MIIASKTCSNVHMVFVILFLRFVRAEGLVLLFYGGPKLQFTEADANAKVEGFYCSTVLKVFIWKSVAVHAGI